MIIPTLISMSWVAACSGSLFSMGVGGLAFHHPRCVRANGRDRSALVASKGSKGACLTTILVGAGSGMVGADSGMAGAGSGETGLGVSGKGTVAG